MEILKLENVSYRYKSKYQTVEAVKQVNYSFESGKIYAIVGRSGSGKTTLLSLLAGLDLPTEGEVKYQGTSTNQMDRDKYRREEAAVIYQAFHLFPQLNSVENIMYPMELKKQPYKEAKKRAETLMKSVGLGEKLFRSFPSMMSGGEQQRVAIARALAAEPKILLADEPTGNLDGENSEVIVELLKELAHKQQYCVIVVTHDEGIANQCDAILHMADGKITA